MKKFLALLLCLSAALSPAVTVLPEQSVVVLAPKADAIKKLAAEELVYHLKLITGKDVPITAKAPAKGFAFFVGERPASDRKELIREEARFLVTPQSVHLYGEDHIAGDILRKYSRTGTLFAVYDFLEKQLGVRWIEPGERGVIFTPSKTLQLKEGSSSWTPGRLIQREVRPGSYSYAGYMKHTGKNVPPPFLLSEKDFRNFYREVMIFFKRHKMGSSQPMSYGHAFTDWWTKYGKEHPEYFAMQTDGVRRPAYLNQPDRSKMCVSSEALQDKIVGDWAKRTPRSGSINVCENDSRGYCRCPGCRKLDVPKTGEEFDTHMTDRYIFFANTIQRKAAKIDPNVSVLMYTYSDYRFPPRREKVDPRLILGFVPSMMELDKVDQMYQAWHKAGARKVFLRPNDQHINTGLPMGFEKQLFDHFQLGVRYGIIGTDYDTCHNFWPATGIADYILLRAHSDPSQSFEHWEKEYCSAFGAAADDVRDYYRYFRNQIFENRLKPNLAEILRVGRYGNFRRGLMWDIKKYYNEKDFDTTDAVLKRGLTKKLTAPERNRLEKLLLANRHARLSYRALVASNKFVPGRELLQFREKHRDDLSFDWSGLIAIEKEFGDVTGVQAAYNFRNFAEVQPTPYRWLFRLDPENVGKNEKWETGGLGVKGKGLASLRTDRAWERQVAKEVGEALHKQLADYDGIGYYMQNVSVPAKWQGKKILLYFGAVDESAWIYVNGKFAGERLFKKPNDWQEPFTIDITNLIDWKRARQNVVVRVEDKAGQGGIWKPIFLVRE